MKVRSLTKKQTEELKAKILDEKNRLIFKGVVTSEDFNIKDEDRADELDQATAALQNAQHLRFRNREVMYSRKLDGALERIRAESYGLCEECGQPIGYLRLLARPTAEMCIICKEEAERDESLSIVGTMPKSIGQDSMEFARQG